MDDPPADGGVGLAPRIDPLLRAAVMASRTPMVATDPALPDNPMVLANQAFCRMTGYDPASLVGRNCRMLQGPRTDPEAVAALREAVAAQRETTVELLNYRRDGSSFWSEVFLAPVRDAQGRLRYFVASQNDTTARRTDEAEAAPDAALPRPEIDRFARTASWRWSVQDRLIHWGEAAGALFGTLLPEAMEVRDWAALALPADQTAAMRGFAAIRAMGQANFEFRIARGEEQRWLEMAGSVVQRGADGVPSLMTGVVTDITGRRQAERALQEREARTRLALAAARAGTWELDTRTGRAITSPRHDDIMGHSQIDGAWSLDRFASVLAPADRLAATAEIQAAVQARDPFHIIARLQPHAGLPVRWIEAWGRPAGADGATYFGIVTDITERRAAEEALVQAEAGFRLALDAAHFGRWDYDSTGSGFVADDRLRRLFGGLTPMEGGLDSFLRRIHPDDHAALRDKLADARDPAGTGALATEFRLASLGEEPPRWLRCYGKALFDKGMCVRLLGVCQDITEEKRTAIDLQDMNRALEAQVEARTAERDRTWRLSHELLAVTEVGQGIVAVNPAWERTLGFTTTELLGRSMVEIVHPEDLEATMVEMLRAEAGTVSLQFRNRCRTVDGGWRHISWTTVPEGRQFYLSGRDVTKIVESAEALEQAEAQMRQMQKMEAVGQLTGGIAHDFNNMLSVVIGGLSLIQRRLDRGGTDIRMLIDQAMDGARRAGALTQRLLAFSRQQPLQPRVLDVAALVAGMSDLLRRTLGETVRLTLPSPAGPLWVDVDASQMENVILNLAVNARDAMPEGGMLSIRMGSVDLAPEQEPDLAAGPYARIDVTDTGIGMAPEVAARAFDPFFTTKGVGAGTGLGLSQVYGFARQSGGAVRIQSAQGAGTTLRVLLPRAAPPEPADDEGQDRQDGPAAAPRARVLLVEDDDRVRQFSASALRELGYEVIEADGARAALAALAGDAGIALLFTDVVMPDTNGRDLADEAVRRHPGLRVLFTTGYERHTLVHEGKVEEGRHLLAKPFTLDQLAGALRAVLEGPMPG